MKLLKYKKFTGLHIVCKKCNRNIEVSNVVYKGCEHPIEKQKYKALFRIDGVRKTKDLKSREYDDAIKELLAWKDELANPIKFKTTVAKKGGDSELLIDCIYMFSDWLENIDVPRQEQKHRSAKHIKETVLYLTRFSNFLKKNGYNLNKLTVYEVDKHAIGKYYEHLEKTIEKATTFNHNIRALKNFFNFIQNEKQFPMLNPVKKAKLKHENPDPKGISDDDFIKLLETINENDSFQVFKNGKRKNRYRTWLKDGIELLAYTGMRLEETASLKYSDIKLYPNGALRYLEGIDLKYNRTHNFDKTKSDKKVPIPITPELQNLLERLDYKNNLGSNKYLIDGDCNMNRSSLAKSLSHAFTFYRRKVGLPDGISVRHLRKTFLTKLEVQTGLVQSAGYQKSIDVIRKNYLDKIMIADEIQNKGFSYYDDKERVYAM